MAYEVIQIDAGTYRIEENGFVRFFVLEGEKEALMIDTGMQGDHVRELAERLTDKPLKLIVTHADRDHVGGNQDFDSFYMSGAEASNYYSKKAGAVAKPGEQSEKAEPTFIPVENGDVLDLGNRPIEIVTLPGHTPGSIGLLDVNNRVLISGDPIQDGTIYMFGVQREMHAYMASLRKLAAYRDRFDFIYPSHGSFPIKPDKIDRLLAIAEDIMAGKCEPVAADMFGTKVHRYETAEAVFLLDAPAE